MTGDQYDILYKRYLKRSPKEMLELAGMKKGYSVLDLCCGSNGRASKMAMEMGASYVCGVDMNPWSQKLRLEGIDIFYGTINDFFGRLNIDRSYGRNKPSNLFPDMKFDIVICQQAINYWLKADGTMNYLNSIMKNGAKFVFNTFNKKPSDKITVKEYEIDSLRYVEVFNCYTIPCGIQSRISHLQAVDGLPPHYSEFDWISPEQFRDILQIFDIEVKTEKTTDIYICTKKP